MLPLSVLGMQIIVTHLLNESIHFPLINYETPESKHVCYIYSDQSSKHLPFLLDRWLQFMNKQVMNPFLICCFINQQISAAEFHISLSLHVSVDSGMLYCTCISISLISPTYSNQSLSRAANSCKWKVERCTERKNCCVWYVQASSPKGIPAVHVTLTELQIPLWSSVHSSACGIQIQLWAQRY